MLSSWHAMAGHCMHVALSQYALSAMCNPTMSALFAVCNPTMSALSAMCNPTMSAYFVIIVRSLLLWHMQHAADCRCIVVVLDCAYLC